VQQLPLIGGQFSQLNDVKKFVDNVTKPLHSALVTLSQPLDLPGLPTPADGFPSDAQIKAVLLQYLGPQTANILGHLQGGAAPASNPVPVAATGLTHDAANLGDKGFLAEVHLHVDPLAGTSSTVDFSTGLPKLPLGLQAGVKGGVSVQVGFDYELSFGYNAKTSLDQALFINNDARLADGHQLEFSVVAGLTPGAEVGVNIGFLSGSIKDAGNTGLKLTATLDGLGSSPSFRVVAPAAMHLLITAGFGGADPALPSIGAKFSLHWAFDSDQPNAAPPQVAFTGVGFDAGKLITGILKPIIQDIQQVTKPLEPVLQLINQPIPGLSD